MATIKGNSAFFSLNGGLVNLVTAKWENQVLQNLTSICLLLFRDEKEAIPLRKITKCQTDLQKNYKMIEKTLQREIEILQQSTVGMKEGDKYESSRKTQVEEHGPLSYENVMTLLSGEYLGKTYKW